MEKKCEFCGHTTIDANALYCERCGKPYEKAENAQIDDRATMDERTNKEIAPEQKKTDKTQERLIKADKRKKTLFALAFIGLLLDFVFGVGAFLCLPVGILAAVDGKRTFEARKKMTTWHLWAIVVGGLGTVFGAAFMFLMF